MYLLDTHVLSETRKRKPHGGVLAWFASVDDALLRVPAVTIGEIQAGIENIRPQDSAKALEITAWLEEIEASHSIVVADSTVFRIAARFMVAHPKSIFEDALIAATAARHGYTVVTRNIKDFRRFDVRLLNPFETPREP